jgi:hypothetical protein
MDMTGAATMKTDMMFSAIQSRYSVIAKLYKVSRKPFLRLMTYLRDNSPKSQINAIRFSFLLLRH